MNHILVPTDFSEICDNAARHACEAARFLNGKVVLLHVINKDTHAFLKKENAGPELINRMLEAEQDRLRSAFGIDISTRVVEGSIFERIPEIASQEEARVVFLGTHGKVGIQKLTGSFALKVVTRIPVPTFVVQKSSFGNGYRTVVVPVSNHQQIPLKCHWANYIAGLFDAEVHLFVIEDDNPVFARIIHSATAEIESHLKRKGIRVLVSRASHQGDFAGQLLGYAQSIRAELIQIITDAVAPNSEYVLGPWDEKILFNRVHIPVMCINPIPL